VLGLTDTQVQSIYKIQNKHNTEIEKLKAKINELETTRDKEMKAVLTPEQKKRLDDILTGKEK
jgi:Spy/CpxP family protein refolding chaperone